MEMDGKWKRSHNLFARRALASITKFLLSVGKKHANGDLRKDFALATIFRPNKEDGLIVQKAMGGGTEVL